MMTDPEHEIWLRRLYIFLAATAGSVTGALVDKRLSLRDKVSAFFVGVTAAIFVGPLLLSRFAPGVDITSPEAVGFYYLFATVSNSVLPLVIRKARQMVEAFGSPAKGEVK